MGILTRFTLRSLARNRARTAATVLGIALSCALVTAIFTTVTSIGGGLLQREMELDGSWQLASPRVSDHKLSELRADDHVTSLAAGRELGSTLLSYTQAETAGRLLTVKSLPVMEKGAGTGPTGAAAGTYGTSDVGLAQAPAPTSGRLPDRANEIMLPSTFEGLTPDGTAIKANGALELGSTVTLELGERTFTASETGEQSTLSSADDYATAQDGWVEGSEELTDVRARTFTVVGFCSPSYSVFSGSFAGSEAGSVAIVGPVSEDGDSTTDAAGNDLSHDGFAIPYLSTDFRRYNDLETWATALLSTATNYATVKGSVNGQLTASSPDSGGYVLHMDLLRYQGLTEDRAIWSTLWQLAGILVAVVMVASVSLIYTSFAISVTERMRQFGLLSGIGASKRQLRRTVVAEALALGVVGIPLGIALGIAGTAATLGITQSGFASILGTETTMGLVVDVRALALAVALSFVTLVVSAWIPAARAGHVSAVDAIRQTASARRSRRERRGHGGLGGKLAQRLFGVGGLMARRNLARSSSRGRIVVVSLAVSVALVVICGDIDAYMRPLANLAGGSAAAALNADLAISVHARTGDSTGQTNANSSDAAITPDRFRSLAAEAADVEGATSKGSHLEGMAQAVLPASMLDTGTVEQLRNLSGFDVNGSDAGSTDGAPASLDSYVSPYAANGDVVSDLHVYYVDDDTWAAYVQSLGLDLARYTDAAHPLAIAVNAFDTNDGSRYLSLAPFSGGGTITAYGGVYGSVRDRDGWINNGLVETSTGEVVIRYTKLNDARTDLELNADGSPVIEDVPVASASLPHSDIEVGSLADTLPDELLSSGAAGSFPSIVLPLSAADSMVGQGRTIEFTGGQIYLAASDPTQAEQDLDALSSRLFPSRDGNSSVAVFNVAEARQNNVDAAATTQLFVLLFSVITMLIALANVFNTLTNSIVLRTREFAILRSAGMGNRAFARMVAYECVSYAWRGLLGGLVLGLGVSWLMWKSMALSFMGLSMAIPWGYIAAAAASALLVLALSVLYALHRAHTQNLVEALRQDAL